MSSTVTALTLAVLAITPVASALALLAAEGTSENPRRPAAVRAPLVRGRRPR